MPYLIPRVGDDGISVGWKLNGKQVLICWRLLNIARVVAGKNPNSTS